eukprot:2569331-Rhodomonas_salina.4
MIRGTDKGKERDSLVHSQRKVDGQTQRQYGLVGWDDTTCAQARHCVAQKATCEGGGVDRASCIPLGDSCERKSTEVAPYHGDLLTALTPQSPPPPPPARSIADLYPLALRPLDPPPAPPLRSAQRLEGLAGGAVPQRAKAAAPARAATRKRRQ